MEACSELFVGGDTQRKRARIYQLSLVCMCCMDVKRKNVCRGGMSYLKTNLTPFREPA